MQPHAAFLRSYRKTLPTAAVPSPTPARACALPFRSTRMSAPRCQRRCSNDQSNSFQILVPPHEGLAPPTIEESPAVRPALRRRRHTHLAALWGSLLDVFERAPHNPQLPPQAHESAAQMLIQKVPPWCPIPPHSHHRVGVGGGAFHLSVSLSLSLSFYDVC
ncbi:hypothetical protein TraAM80_05705 [Trypanosoma rangeli]|uniref:Uncharacterized protein n=1 Tax=Trypanosoma rangeli TaxID=5698 RepID=A0A3R7NJJ9_TRYRA|nr:uncharacterized protein TraAM80_05705 [Trypanosoma rangeli]RNF03527.1 hypothetical protein TraAM80_05705 [Trypanosoma rangeli]|eukprot:RNF03527.1 hypothetical protein TraAM80_05705 [Trypanosoma rangeli]